jgi:multidrug efflux system membrane fusion protein
MNASARAASTLMGVALLSSLLGLGACSRQEPPSAPVRPVQVTQVSLGGAGSRSVYAGEVRPRYEGELGFRIGGKIIARQVDVGAVVKKGQALARLDPTDAGLQTDASKAQLAAAETEFNFAKAELDRYQGLLEQKFVSQSALDAKRNAYNSTRARYEQAKAQLAVTQNQARYATLVAEHDGVITAANAEVGQVVAPGQAVFRLARADEREVAISIPEHRLGELKSAKQVLVSLWANPGKIYQGRVREIAPSVDATTRTFAVRVSMLDADAAVRWGMTANVMTQGEGAPGTVLLPLTSIYQKDGKAAVWVFDPTSKQVSLRNVELGMYLEDGVVVRSGLANGEWVVTAGVHKLAPGQVVRPLDTVAKS